MKRLRYLNLLSHARVGFWLGRERLWMATAILRWHHWAERKPGDLLHLGDNLWDQAPITQRVCKSSLSFAHFVRSCKGDAESIDGARSVAEDPGCPCRSAGEGALLPLAHGA